MKKSKEIKMDQVTNKSEDLSDQEPMSQEQEEFWLDQSFKKSARSKIGSLQP